MAVWGRMRGPLCIKSLYVSGLRIDALLWEQEVARSNRVAPTRKLVHYLPNGSGPVCGPLFCNFLCKITPSETPRIASLAL